MTGLNESTGNMYPWVTHTWNAIKGACPHDCSYCYMKRWGKLRQARLDRDELQTDMGTGNFIFVGSSCDMFADSVPTEWIDATLEHCRKYDGNSCNSYLFQTKNPRRMENFGFPLATVVCTTIETNRWYPAIMHNCPTPEQRAAAMSEIVLPRYVTIEPIMDFDTDELVDLVQQCGPLQVNIGADSGNNHLPEPSADKVRELIAHLQTFTKVVKKPNLERIMKHG